MTAQSSSTSHIYSKCQPTHIASSEVTAQEEGAHYLQTPQRQGARGSLGSSGRIKDKSALGTNHTSPVTWMVLLQHDGCVPKSRQALQNHTIKNHRACGKKGVEVTALKTLSVTGEDGDLIQTAAPFHVLNGSTHNEYSKHCNRWNLLGCGPGRVATERWPEEGWLVRG